MLPRPWPAGCTVASLTWQCGRQLPSIIKHIIISILKFSLVDILFLFLRPFFPHHPTLSSTQWQLLYTTQRLIISPNRQNSRTLYLITRVSPNAELYTRVASGRSMITSMMLNKFNGPLGPILSHESFLDFLSGGPRPQDDHSSTLHTHQQGLQVIHMLWAIGCCHRAAECHVFHFRIDGLFELLQELGVAIVQAGRTCLVIRDKGMSLAMFCDCEYYYSPQENFCIHFNTELIKLPQ